VNRNIAPQYQLHRILADAISDEVRVLVAVASSDAPINPHERRLIAKYAQVRADEVQIAIRAHEIDFLVDWTEGRLRDRRAIRDCIERMRLKHPNILEDFTELCELVADVDGAINHAERNSIDFIRETMASVVDHVSDTEPEPASQPRWNRTGSKG
jgi:tellurite resistance protein